MHELLNVVEDSAQRTHTISELRAQYVALSIKCNRSGILLLE